MIRIVADWNRLLSLVVFSVWLVIAIQSRSIGVGFFSWALMSLSFIWWSDEMAESLRVPRSILRVTSWTILLLPLIAGFISAVVNSDVPPSVWNEGSR